MHYQQGRVTVSLFLLMGVYINGGGGGGGGGAFTVLRLTTTTTPVRVH